VSVLEEKFKFFQKSSFTQPGAGHRRKQRIFEKSYFEVLSKEKDFQNIFSQEL
jgi:hypothetical protein